MLKIEKIATALMAVMMLLLSVSVVSASTNDGVTVLVTPKGKSVDVSVKNNDNDESVNVTLQPQVKTNSKWSNVSGSFSVNLKEDENRRFTKKFSNSGRYRYKVTTSRSSKIVYSSQFNIK